MRVQSSETANLLKMTVFSPLFYVPKTDQSKPQKKQSVKFPRAETEHLLRENGRQ